MPFALAAVARLNLIFAAAVNAPNVRPADATASRRWLALLGSALCLTALVSLLWQTGTQAPRRLWIPFGMVALAFGIEGTFRLFGAEAGRAAEAGSRALSAPGRP